MCRSSPRERKNRKLKFNMNKDIRMIQAKGHSSLRVGRFSRAGQIYHITFSTQDRKPHFSDFTLSRTFISILKQDECLGYTKTLAFCVMPDHVHWLVELTKGRLDSAVKRIKSIFTRQVGRSIWGYGFYDHGVRNEESLISVARYIVANPLRAGIVQDVRCYPHWDCIWLE